MNSTVCRFDKTWRLSFSSNIFIEALTTDGSITQSPKSRRVGMSFTGCRGPTLHTLTVTNASCSALGGTMLEIRPMWTFPYILTLAVGSFFVVPKYSTHAVPYLLPQPMSQVGRSHQSLPPSYRNLCRWMHCSASRDLLANKQLKSIPYITPDDRKSLP